jgi:tRNA G18 (ribose-2'-O)-methylase SpoU
VEVFHPHSSDDPVLDEVRLLRSPDRMLTHTGTVVVEGFTLVQRWLHSGRALQRLVVTPAQWTRLEAVAMTAGVDSVAVVERGVLAAAAGFDVHRGVLGFVQRPSPPSWSEVLITANTLVVVEGINDAENLGALMRSVWALGADAVVLDPTTLDPYGRRVVRVSMGAALELAVVRAPQWPDALDEIRHAGFAVVGLTPRADAVAWNQWGLPMTQPVAVLVGAEGPGLSAAALDRVDVAVRVPMRVGVDSLNVAHAAAIVLAGLDRCRTIRP